MRSFIHKPGQARERSSVEPGRSNLTKKEGEHRHESDRIDPQDGKPLDGGTKAFFESRFGHDFGDVRIYAGSGAATEAGALAAQAFTSGSDVVFNAGKYNPQTVEGRFLLAHELAHVAQQRGSVPSADSGLVESPSLEREASSAAMRIALGGSARVAASGSAPPVQLLKVTAGGFGQELENTTNIWKIPEATLKLLMKSPTFMAMAATLDKHYISIKEATEEGYPPFISLKGYKQLDPSGRISGISPKLDGKRVITISWNPAGANFKTAWSPDNDRCGDSIEVTRGSDDLFIQELIHESAHATRFVTGVNPSAATMADEISVAIQDEIAVRKTEEKALKEIPDKAVQARAATVGSKVARDVQRDMAPAFGLTYLENIYFARKLREQQKAEGLSDTEAEEIASSVRKNPDSGVFWLKPSGRTLSDFAYLCYKRARVVQAWKDFFAKNSQAAKDFATKKEAELQAHVTNWMNNEVSYLP